MKVEFKNISVVGTLSKGWWDNGRDLLRGENWMGVYHMILFGFKPQAFDQKLSIIYWILHKLSL